ncbi:hypothetical protein [Flavobacterium sp. N502540]|uniref:hypothetical protein n=1 Tax=Flavobacterium sp. N502540 TaxID=2986838 RepID=UPI0022249D95|nr:hypothetical protein [Flavobacterium sp. N502540]
MDIKTMIKRRDLVILIVVILQSIIFSCKREENNETEEKTKKESYKGRQIDYKVEFPDTLYVNQLYDGVIKYKSVLDTITTSFDDKKKKRYVLFYLTTVNKPDANYKHLKKSAKIFGADNNRKIYFYNIKFTEPGVFYIDGIINDYVVIDINKKDKGGFDLVREIENEERVIHKVIVINRPAPLARASRS